METSCRWEWLGTQPWENVEDTCIPPDVCRPPDGDGLFIGETREVPCLGVG